MGVATAAAVLTCAPIASADDPDQNGQPSPTAEQEPGQDDAAGIADKAAEGASKGLEGAQKGLEGAEKAAEGASKAGDAASKAGDHSKIDLSDKDCWVINGVPQMGVRPVPAGTTAIPCYYVYGLTPH